MSGSGRLSFAALRAGLMIGFPVDYRYGWNLAERDHRKLLGNLSPKVRFFAPSCSSWSSLSGWMPPADRDLARAKEIPAL
eukprot:6789508-Lingulodinium_polyedra.AAC.1